jgi:signal transduction histidine kinase
MATKNYDITGPEISIRQQINRDLHDIIGRLRNLGVNAKETGSAGNEAECRDLLLLMEEELGDVIGEIQRIVVPFEVDESKRLLVDYADRFVEYLEKLGKRYSSPSRQVTVNCDLEAARKLSPSRYLSVERIVENCLSNAARHANASKVELVLAVDSTQADRWVTLTISDNGVGNPRLNNVRDFEEQTRLEHEGLSIIVRNCDQLSATLESSSTSEGTTFTIKIPC